jgi:hypothetical protein
MKQAIKKLIYPKMCTISPENKLPEEETPEELSLEVESPEKKMVPEISRSQYII